MTELLDTEMTQLIAEFKDRLIAIRRESDENTALNRLLHAVIFNLVTVENGRAKPKPELEAILLELW